MTTDLTITENEPFQITATGLQIAGKPTYEQWVQVGRELWYAKQSIQWCIGDWINYGDHAYGQKYTQAIAETDYQPQTLANYAYTANAFPHTARRENVSFSNHSEIASLKDDDRTFALDRLQSKQWSREDLRQWKREIKGTPEPTEQTITLQWRGHSVKNGILTAVFVAPDDVYEIVEFKAIVRRNPANERTGEGVAVA